MERLDFILHTTDGDAVVRLDGKDAHGDPMGDVPLPDGSAIRVVREADGTWHARHAIEGRPIKLFREPGRDAMAKALSLHATAYLARTAAARHMFPVRDCLGKMIADDLRPACAYVARPDPAHPDVEVLVDSVAVRVPSLGCVATQGTLLMEGEEAGIATILYPIRPCDYGKDWIGWSPNLGPADALAAQFAMDPEVAARTPCDLVDIAPPAGASSSRVVGIHGTRPDRPGMPPGEIPIRVTVPKAVPDGLLRQQIAAAALSLKLGGRKADAPSVMDAVAMEWGYPWEYVEPAFTIRL